MRLLMTASQIRGLPVVTVRGGEDVAEVRAAAGELAEFMRDGANIAARGDRDLKAGLRLGG